MIGKAENSKRPLEGEFAQSYSIPPNSSSSVSQAFKKSRAAVLTENHLENLMCLMDKRENEDRFSAKELILLIKDCKASNRFPFFLRGKQTFKVKGKEIQFPFSVGLNLVKTGGKMGISLLLQPSTGNEVKSDIISYFSAFETFIPEGLEEDEDLFIRKVRVCHEKEERFRPAIQREMGALSAIFQQNPEAIHVFQPYPVAYSTEPHISTKMGARSLFLEKRNEISTLDSLRVCKDVARQLNCLFKANLVNSLVTDRFIVVQKKDEKPMRGFLDSFSQTSLTGETRNRIKAPWLNSLAQNGFVSFETDCYGLVMLMADLFLSQKKPETSSDVTEQKEQWQIHLLKELQKEISPNHFEAVLSLRDRYGGFSEAFCQHLLTYTKTHYEDGFQYIALRKFAFHMAIFPLISDLVFQTLKANADQARLIEEKGSELKGQDLVKILQEGPKIPNLKEIVEVINASADKIQKLRALSDSSQKIQLSQMMPIIEYLSLEEAEDENSKLEIAKILQKHIQEALQGESFREKGEVRLHKREMDLPFSLWVQKDKNGGGVLISVIEWELGSGQCKKVKALPQFFLSSDSSRIPISFEVLSRIYPVIFEQASKGHALHTEIFKKVPDAASYFVPPAKKHMPHTGVFDEKFEWESPWYNGDLEIARKNLALSQSMGGNVESLRYSDLVDCLKNLTGGIRRLEEVGVAHRDLGSSNIFIKKEESGWTAHVADFDHVIDLSRLKGSEANKIMEEGISSDRYSLVLNILYALAPQNCLIKSSLEKFNPMDPEFSEKRNQAIAEAKEDFLTSRKKFLERAQIDVNIDNASLLQVAKEMPADKAREIYTYVASSLFFDSYIADLVSRAYEAEEKSKIYAKEFLEQGDNLQEALDKAFKRANFPNYGEIEAVLDSCKVLTEQYGF